MARIAGVDLPNNKRMVVALTYVYGIGRPAAEKILKQANIDFSVRSDKISETELSRIREVIERDYKVEGELRQVQFQNIKRLKDINCYRGIRHKRGLPVRGQRTRTNAHTRKGHNVAVGGLKRTLEKT